MEMKSFRKNVGVIPELNYKYIYIQMFFLNNNIIIFIEIEF